VLAAAPEGYEFLYVGGARRDKGGLGVVQSGAERLKSLANPWIVLEEPETRDMLKFADLGQWAAALGACGRMAQRAKPGDKPLFDALRGALEGLRLWDGFDHAGGWKAWEQGALPGRLLDLAKVGGRPLIAGFAKALEPMISALSHLARCRDELPRKGPDPLVADLVVNAKRRADAGLLDEAALRLYRAVELLAERRLRLKHGMENDSIKPQQTPEPLRGELLQRKGDPGGEGWKLGLQDTARLLDALGDETGKRIVEALPKLGVHARNNNWLIHGEGHVTEKQWLSFLSHCMAALGIGEGDAPRWPAFGAPKT